MTGSLSISSNAGSVSYLEHQNPLSNLHFVRRLKPVVCVLIHFMVLWVIAYDELHIENAAVYETHTVTKMEWTQLRVEVEERALVTPLHH